MMRILLISHSQKSGGAERCLLEAAIGLKNRGFNVIVFIPGEGQINKLFQEAGIDVKIVSYPWWVHYGKTKFTALDRIKRFLSVLKYTGILKKEIEAVRPNVILSNTICIPCGALAAFWLRIHHVWFIHEFGKEDHHLIFDFGVSFSSKIIERTSKVVLVNSELVKNKFKQFIREKKLSIVNYNVPKPIVAREVLLSTSSSFELLLIGQIKRTKGQLEAIRALYLLSKENYDTHLWVVGQVIEQDYYDELLEYVHTSSLKHRVSFVSHTSHPFSVVTKFTIGLMCSSFEALGRVTIEFMKAGIPVIGANAGSTTRLIGNEENGLLYDCGNDTHLAEKIRQTVDHPEQTKKRTESAKKFAESTFNEENFIEGIVKSFN